jgi:hypothetical protein
LFVKQIMKCGGAFEYSSDEFYFTTSKREIDKAFK